MNAGLARRTRRGESAGGRAVGIRPRR
jgi:hypothetical protein